MYASCVAGWPLCVVTGSSQPPHHCHHSPAYQMLQGYFSLGAMHICTIPWERSWSDAARCPGRLAVRAQAAAGRRVIKLAPERMKAEITCRVPELVANSAVAGGRNAPELHLDSLVLGEVISRT